VIVVKSPAEVEAMRRPGAAVGRFFEELRPHVKPGATTWDLEEVATAYLARIGLVGAFKGYRGYPANLCTSVNEEVVHGIPSRKKVLREGDVVSVDFGVVADGFFGDAARTFPVGKIDDAAAKLLRVTEESLSRAVTVCFPGNRLGDVGEAVQEHVESNGFSVVRDFVGHGIGREMHEDPQVPNFGRRGTGPRLVAGMVLAIEPMVNEGRFAVEVLGDGWTVVTRDRKRSAHFEHTVAITEGGPSVLTLPS
jgi:methionyl aminopeptidase